MAPPRRRKSTSRQRRKQSARAGTNVSPADEGGDNPQPIAAEGATTKTRGKAKKAVPQETWPRRELAVLVGVALILLAIISAILAGIAAALKLDAGITFVSNFVGLDPIILAPALWVAMLLVYKRLGVRRMRFLEAMLMGMMLFFVASTAGGYLTGNLTTSTAPPSPIPTSSGHATAAPTTSAPRPKQSASPSAGTTPEPTAKTSPQAKPCPVDSSCSSSTVQTSATQFQEALTAGILGMVLGIATTIWGYPTVYRWFWGARKPRTPPAKGKGKVVAKGKR